MNKHTAEPWRAFVKGRTFEVQGEAALPIAAWTGFDDSRRPIAEHRANVLRIVACVNACEGINPEWVPDMLDMLKTIENDAGQVPEWLWVRIQAVIAKAEGRTT